KKLEERNEALEAQLSLLTVSDHSSRHTQSIYSPVPQPRVHTPQITTIDRPIPLPRSKLPQRPVDKPAGLFRQDRLQDLEQRLQQLERTSQPNYARPTQRQSFPQTSYDRVDDSRSGYSLNRLCIPPSQEITYRGPAPTIPNFVKPDPREFSRLRIALENILPADATERFKYQILVDHLKFEESLLIADSYCNSLFPFSETMEALNQQYGQPHQLALQRIAELMDGPNVSHGDVRAFRMFALKVRSLVSMLQQLGNKGYVELECGSHVSRLLSSKSVTIHKRAPQRDTRQPFKATSIFLGTEKNNRDIPVKVPDLMPKDMKTFCPYCDAQDHYLNGCVTFQKLNRDQKVQWIQSHKRCWRCGRAHQAAQCNLKTLCKICNRRHLYVLHEVNDRSFAEKPKIGPSESCLVNTTAETLYLDRPTDSRRVLLKICKVLLRNGNHCLETYALLDDGSERTILLHSAAQQLGLTGRPEELVLRTVRQDLHMLRGASVTFTVSPASQPKATFRIHQAFTAETLGLAEHTYPVDELQRKYSHLQGLQLPHVESVQPLLLIGSDYPHLITPVEPVRLGPPNGPAAIKTRLGWTLQGPTQEIKHHLHSQQCLFTATSGSYTDLFRQVEKLWQLDVLPYRSEKLITRSKQDQDAISLLESKTTRVTVDGVARYATPLLRVKNMPLLQASPENTLPCLRGIERRLARDPVQAATYQVEMNKLKEAGYAKLIPPDQVDQAEESWYIPHHMTQHNGKNRVVFNCSFVHGGNNLNQLLLPGPTLGPSLMSVLLRFRQHTVALSSDIRGMFHQSFSSQEEAKVLASKLRDLLATGGFDLRQWASNVPQVLDHIPSESKSSSLVLWLTQVQPDAQESALGLHWHCTSDTLSYKHRPIECSAPTMRHIYKDSCRFKVFIGTRVAEIQELTDPEDWRYVDSKSNPADDITRGKTLAELAKPSRWSQGPSFLLLAPDQWPQSPLLQLPTEDAELKSGTFCGLTVPVTNPALPDCNQFTSYKQLLTAGARVLHGQAHPSEALTAEAVYLDLLYQMDTDSFLMALRRFISRRGKPFEIISDHGTNFKGGERALQEDFAELHPSLQEQLASHQISFKFNPPGAPHFGADHFWRRFLRNYLPEFQVRQKWRKEAVNLQPGTVVMIVDHQLPRALWPVGQVTKVFPGEDGRTRAAEVEVKGKSYIRPITRLISLPALLD
ncbi:hypothetical protein PO909_027706, partial [Leuciscus waleckii]